MSEGSINFTAGQNSGLDPLSGVSPLYVNLLSDAAGGCRMRPGVRRWQNFPSSVANQSPIIGVYSWRQWVLFVREDRSIAGVQSPGSVVELSSADPTTRLDGTLRPIWAYDQERVVVTGGGAPQKWEGIGLSSRLAPGAITPSGSPLALTHIAYSSQRFIGNDNDNSGVWQWTDPGADAHGVWPVVGAYFVEAEASPDPLVALYVNANEVFTFGTQTMQVYTPDATLVFAPSNAVQLGCSAPYSVIDTDGSFAWLDDRRRFVQSGGRDFQVLSNPGIANDIMQPGFVVSDCWGLRLCIGTFDLLMWVFPTEKRGFYFDRTIKKWGEFRSIDANGNWTAWIPNCYYFLGQAAGSLGQNVHLVGLDNGTIGEVTFDAVTDMNEAIKGISDTGFQDRGTFRGKACQRVQMQVRRGGTVPPGPAPIVELKYRDDLGAWKPGIRWSTGVGGDYQPVVDAWNLGIYRQREWRLEWSGGGPFVMTGVTENFELTDV